MKNPVINTSKKKLLGIPWLFLLSIVFLLSAIIGFAVIPHSLAAQVTMVVYQQEGNKVFGRETSLNIFDDPKLNGQKLVHPYSKGSYVFAVYNSSQSDALPYAISIVSDNPDNIPLTFSIQKNGEYIFGSYGLANMLPIDELKLSECLLGGTNTDLYTIHWQWRTQSDEIDTAIGNIGTQTYSLNITVTGTIAEDDVPGGEPIWPITPGTGDGITLLPWLTFMLAGIVLLIALIPVKRRKREDDNG